MKRLQFSLVFMLFICMSFMTSLQAQEVTLDKVMRFQLRNSGPILSGNQIDGYYFFYQVDKIDRKTRAYLLKIFDANLKEVSSKMIEGSKFLTLLEGGFNGATLMLEFYDYKAEQYVLKQYDRDAELLNETRADGNSRLSPVLMQGDDSEIRADFLHPIRYQGFINLRTVKNKKIGYEAQFISIDRTNKGWTYGSAKDSKLFELAGFLDGNSELAVFAVTKKPSLLSAKIDFFLQGLSIETGKEVFLTPLQDKNYQLYPLKGQFDPETGHFRVLGQYYKPKDNPVKHKSLGLFSKTYDENGEELSSSFVSWIKDVSKFVDVNEKGKIQDVGYVYFHYMTKLADGKIYAIGEQYRKGVSGAGIAMRMIAAAGGGTADASTMKIVTEDIMVFQFSSDFKLEGIKIFDKSKTNINFPAGYGNVGIVKLGHLLKALDWFDYSFTQMPDEQDGFIIGYVDYEKLKKEKNRTVFGGIVFKDGEYSVDKIPFSTRGSERLQILPGKPGYVSITEYDRRSKTISVRLEKINY